jgi:hypothetical protein
MEFSVGIICSELSKAMEFFSHRDDIEEKVSLKTFCSMDRGITLRHYRFPNPSHII